MAVPATVTHQVQWLPAMLEGHCRYFVLTCSEAWSLRHLRKSCGLIPCHQYPELQRCASDLHVDADWRIEQLKRPHKSPTPPQAMGAMIRPKRGGWAKTMSAVVALACAECVVRGTSQSVCVR